MRSWLDRGACLALLLAACAGDDGNAGGKDEADIGDAAVPGAVASAGPWTAIEQRPCPDDSALTYENFGGPFFLDYCEGCHGGARAAGERQNAPIAARFDDLAAIRKQAAKIWLKAADDNRAMPPVGGPPQLLRTQLGEWLACGAPARADVSE